MTALYSLAFLFFENDKALTDRESFEKSSGRYFVALIISSFIVAIGVALEWPEAWHSFISWRKVRKKGDAKPEENHWRIPASFFGLILVIAGVIGEVIFEALASNSETKIRAIDSERIEAAEQGARDALQKARLSQSSADQAILDARAALREANQGETLASEDEKRASALEKEATRLQLAALLQMPREETFVDKRRQNIFQRSIAPYAGQKVEVRYRANSLMPLAPYDDETSWIAFDLTVYFYMAKWVSPPAILDVASDHGTGLFIMVSKKSSKKTREAAEALARALANIPLEVRVPILGTALRKGSLVSSIDIPDRVKQPNNYSFPPFDDENTVLIEVGAHP